MVLRADSPPNDWSADLQPKGKVEGGGQAPSGPVSSRHRLRRCRLVTRAMEAAGLSACTCHPD
jgi:hypothetical protein